MPNSKLFVLIIPAMLRIQEGFQVGIVGHARAMLWDP
jgi:hypothetical protein